MAWDGFASWTPSFYRKLNWLENDCNRGYRSAAVRHHRYPVASSVSITKERLLRILSPGFPSIAIRLTERNEAVLDYLLLRTTVMTGPLMRFSEKARERHGPESFGSFDALVKSLSRRVNKASRASPTKPARPNKQSRSGQAKRKTSHARR